MPESQLNRRGFLKALGTAVAAAGVSPRVLGVEASSVTVVVDPSDRIAAEPPAAWAIEEFLQALKARGVEGARVADAGNAAERGLRIYASSLGMPLAQRMLSDAGVKLAAVPEAVGIVAVTDKSGRALLACGHDVRGLVYALTDLADLVRNAPDALAALATVETTVERPANEVRSLTRLFTSDVEDKPWFNDRAMWPRYFDMLATQRFNRFNLAFGIGYDFIRHVTDAYFLFTYPFLLKVPGYDVRVPQLPDDERDRNLDMLKYISAQCVMRGLDFHVGLWMHGYVWIDSPDANYTVEGLNNDNHGPYCRDAVRLLLQQVPNIHGLTFRIHGESGVAEGSFDFWKTVFDGVATCGRRVPIEMHTKGMSQKMIEIALATKQPVSMGPKYWGEHMGMTYHQADIRKLEKPRAEDEKGLMALSSGTRSFLRYGYGDLLREDRQWSVVHRIWPGTQRLLLGGDPVFAAGYSRAFSFCGSNGVEIMEPLSFKGRRGSGIAGNRCAYADASLTPRWDWQKYEYTTRIWGRLLYNPEARPEVWRRALRRQFGKGAEALETALANVSRILPIVTTSHAPSAANNAYWPELYCNQSIVDAEHYEPYSDSETPRIFGNASPFDPELFLSMNDCAEELLEGKASGKYTPIEVAQWIEDFAAAGRTALGQANAVGNGLDKPEYRRARVDIEIQASLGEFFGAKFRSGVLYHVYVRTKNQAALKAGIEQYRKARSAYAAAARVAEGVYLGDITFGEQSFLRGHWADRLPAMDKDIAALSALLGSSSVDDASEKAAAAIKAALGRPIRVPVHAEHSVPGKFERGRDLRIAIIPPADAAGVRLHYRRVDQAENYVRVDMARQGAEFAAVIPADYTRTEFPLEYYFEVRKGDGTAGLFPGFMPELTNQPYFVAHGS
ncbi:MAG TPA: twin-arginine translocation signal domain-containing protein [Terracidiphilus sp.]|nr:twin-arginine translocation signal domain-containing protein [Terracidiphilus sp.]